MRKEKEDHHVADEIKVIVDDTEMRSLEESQLDMDETTVVEEKTSTADHDIDEPVRNKVQHISAEADSKVQHVFSLFPAVAQRLDCHR